jgi:hypothetical protein
VTPVFLKLEGYRGVVGSGGQLALGGIKDGLVPLIDVAEALIGAAVDDVGREVRVDVDVLVGVGDVTDGAGRRPR